MHKYKKRGSILFKNLFSILLITMLYISISRVININVKAMRSILLTKDIINKIDIIKYELFFNNQYIHIKGDTYINANNIKLDKYKELNQYFENYKCDNSEYFRLYFDEYMNDITIEYIKDDQMIFKDKLEI
ncbi:hypothetical protein SFBM_0982 [Candidatus Arthromitus sp. SFB-mouse-Japan]|uniref:hypothetical protein n=1 Tax=unclassified Candidatus Neoarthromitus TaxID=2638829 RepID=UPI00021B7D83|nr:MULTISPECIES: hypothetical protein [unclassified Candidatus Arthromitus]EIA24527.1 hypothetical protein SFB1_055G36 [Candidatus Arthromitus sp. SFB-1]EIA27410.1 hypothetical protein SFB4_183G1 [Candidatus Arthromitus sp. SFB-4]EIA28769.1 hypothetical protein SFB6_030G39 [Candidatus Arthromitus sp. SFB-co]EIA31019.1 hypothetical protein SFBSU_006G700 [Candidatus Arthromitus sp. SFB-mouse-SU]AID44962.1 Hypothetical protein SFBmNL_01057 [Candidatus Arthromitus sp. SFB-mouse-NL]